MSFFYDLTSCDSPDASTPAFATFHDYLKGVGGLVSEQCAVLGTLKSNDVVERGGRLDSFRSDLYIYTCVLFGCIDTSLPCSL